jgi:hypothetical protein
MKTKYLLELNTTHSSNKSIYNVSKPLLFPNRIWDALQKQLHNA